MSAIDRDQLLCERLNRHPRLRARVESLVAGVEDAAGDGKKAAAAERRVIEALRQMGHDARPAWAERGVAKRTAVAQTAPGWRPGGKNPLLVPDRRAGRGDRTALAERHGH